MSTACEWGIEGNSVVDMVSDRGDKDDQGILGDQTVDFLIDGRRVEQSRVIVVDDLIQ